MKWEHPDLGVVAEMEGRQQEIKGWKHLYDPDERWDQLVDVPAAQLHSVARANACPQWSRPVPTAPRLATACRSCLRRHHDQLWRDAYGAELLATRNWVGQSKIGRRPLVLATPRGVWIVLTSPHADRVFDAYRPHPPGRGVHWEEDDFVQQARWRFAQETGRAMPQGNTDLQREIARPVDAWHLALAVGAARARALPEERDLLREAERRLEAAPSQWKSEALPPAGAVLDALEAALEDASPDMEDASRTVLDIEDALVATEVLSGRPAAHALREKLEGLAAWAPESWQILESVVSIRLDETTGVAHDWWCTLEDVVAGLSARGVEAVHSPSAVLASRLTAAPWWEQWSARLHGLIEDLVAPARIGVQAASAHLGATDEPWVVSGEPIKAGTLVFVVDAENPAGENVTEDLEEGGPFWQLEAPGQEAYIVCITGVSSTSDLATCLEEATRTPGAEVQVAWVNRPN